MGRPGIKILVYSIGVKRGMYFPSLLSAAKELNLQASHVSEVLSGKRKSHKNMTFVHASNEEEKS